MTVYYTPDHEWLMLAGDIATVGITQHAADALGDLVFVDIPPVGRQFASGDAAAVVESVKAASDIYAPVKGEVVEVNERVADEPGLVSTEPEGAGWLFKLKIANEAELSDLLDRQAYDALVGHS